ncbi:MAG: hypothetical protein NXH75_01095 [Halobacteriovoraceae bacterium]|nr:hypothetical protein [Halobacteriovoraceae bacterium]
MKACLRNLFFVIGLLFLGQTSYSLNAEEPCQSTVIESRPLDEKRDAGVFTTTSAIACENAGSSFYVNNIEVLDEISTNVVGFCWDNMGSDESICEDNTYFNFKRHPDQMENFVSFVGEYLDPISLPDNVSSLKEGTDLTDIQIKAMMYLCTIDAQRDFVNVLNNPSLSDRDKLNAIEAYKGKGLFTQFMNSPEFMEVIKNSSLSETIRKELIAEALSNENGEQPIREIASRFKLINSRSDRTESEEKLLTLLTNSIDEFLTSPKENQNRFALQMLATEGFPGAQEAYNAHLSGANSSPAGAGDKTATLLTEAPNCSEVEDATLRDKSLARNLMYEFLLTEKISDDTISPLVDSTKYISHFAENFNDDKRWSKFERHLTLSSKVSNIEETINAARAFYCFNKKLNQKLNSLNSRSTPNKNEIAGEILVELLSMNPGIDMLSAVHAIQPFLNDDQVGNALTLIRNMGSVPNMERNQVAEAIRIRVLTDIFSRYTGQIERGGRLHPNSRTAIVALAENGGKSAEENLSNLFVQYDSAELRVHILNQYGNPFFLNNVRNQFSIVSKLSSIEDRAQYADYLIKKIQKVATTDGFTGTGSANTRDKVLTSIRDGFVSDITTLVSPDVDGTLSAETRRQQGIVDGRIVDSPVVTEKRPIVLANTAINDYEQKGKISNVSNRERQANFSQGMGAGKPVFTSGFSVASSEDIINQKKNKDDEIQELLESGGEGSEGQSGLEFRQEMNSQKESGGSGGAGSGAGGSPRIQNNGNAVMRNPTPPSQILPNNQKDLITGLGNNLLPNTFDNGNFSPLPQVGEVSTGTQGSDSFNSSFRGGELSSPIANTKASNLKGNEPVSETARRIEKLTNEAKNLREEITKRDEAPQRLPVEDGTNSFIPNISPRVGDLNPDRSKSRVPAGNIAPARGPASVPGPPSSSAVQNTGRGPASISSGNTEEKGPSNNTGLAQGAQNNPYTTILSPIEDLSKEDLSKVIKIKDKVLKDLLMDFMTERKKLSCPELRFVQDFYETHIDNFILVKKRKPWREYALVEMEDLTFRFNYPGGKKVQDQIKERCDSLSREVSSIGEDDIQAEKATSNEMTEKALPSEENTSIFKSFLLKFGL